MINIIGHINHRAWTTSVTLFHSTANFPFGVSLKCSTCTWQTRAHCSIVRSFSFIFLCPLIAKWTKDKIELNEWNRQSLQRNESKQKKEENGNYLNDANVPSWTRIWQQSVIMNYIMKTIVMDHNEIFTKLTFNI